MTIKQNIWALWPPMLRLEMICSWPILQTGIMPGWETEICPEIHANEIHELGVP